MDHAETQRIWIEDFKIHSYEIDMKGTATVPILCKFMQECAWHHAENLRVGYSQLSKNGLAWVLSQQRIRFNALPKWGETIRIHTWPSAQKRLAYLRDFKILDETKQVIILARTKWYAIDLKRRRPQNVNSYFDYNTEGNEQVFSEPLKKLPEISNSRAAASFEVRFSDLDVNGHVNNVRYLEWIWDSFSPDFHRANFLREIEIHYLAEAFFSDKVSVRNDIGEYPMVQHKIIGEKEAKELCRAQTVWRANK
ncbi:MAG TPA: hypothetical protein ENH29_11000 [Bacteroidetes bacterium]|nr:hypothetical protein [Bacteroidota bacterium]